MALVSIPDGPYQEHLADIVRCDYEEIAGTDLFDASLDSRISHPKTHVGNHDIWWRYKFEGFASGWEPGRSSTFRFGPWFVLEEARGQGIGKALVLAWFQYGLDRPDIDKLDTYTFYPSYFKELGFDLRAHYENQGTYHLTYDTD